MPQDSEVYKTTLKKTFGRFKQKREWPVITPEEAKFFSGTQVLTMYFLTHFLSRSVSIS